MPLAPDGPNSEARQILTRCFRAAIAAVDPGYLTGRALRGGIVGAEDLPRIVDSARRIFLLAAGKAAGKMALAAERKVAEIAGPKLADALAVVLSEPPNTGSAIRFIRSSHPIPDRSSADAARAALGLLAKAAADDLVIVALSGGASAMLTMAAETLTLDDKIAINAAMLRAGAPIREFNIVRKHLSGVKGGRLLRAANGARVLSLILSDVPDNDLATIGSGLTAADPSTFGDAISILKRRHVWGRAPESVRDYLERGAAGQVDETVKPGDPALSRVVNVVIGDNSTALDAAAAQAQLAGFSVVRARDLSGAADETGRYLAKELGAIESAKTCVLAGGEAVVTVRGGGKGGRAQQCALAMAIELGKLAPKRTIAALFAGTDGIDGPTDAAGAFAFPDSVARAGRAGLNAEVILTRNDAYNLFAELGDLFITGPTGTNVADVFIGIVNY